MTEICAYCGAQIVLVDLRGTEFFRHVRKQDAMAWRHVEKERNLTHSAAPVK